MSWWRLGATAVSCLLLIAWMLSPVSALAEQRYALVIGNATYAVGALANPRNDAEAIARALRATDFEVTTLIDADQQSMRRAVLELGRKLRASDAVGLLYYAGHGVQLSGENYLIPIGADITDEREVALQGVNVAEVLRSMARTSTGINIVILDACRNNPYESSLRGIGRGLAPVDAPAGTLLAFATAPGQVALDGDSGNSPYSQALAQSIPAPGLVLEEVFRRTRREVLAATKNRQTPWEHSSLTGEFYFKPKTAQPETSNRAPEGSDLDVQRLAEIRAWETVRETRDPALLRRHLAQFPNGLMAELVRSRLEQVTAPSAKGSDGTVAGWNSETKIAGRGDPEAERLLAEAVKLSALGTSEAHAAAFQLYRAAVARGQVAAMHELARAYDQGRGTGKSHIEAAVWYRRAADLGHAPAMASLGTMYEYAEGVPIDIIEAQRLYRAAAEAGDVNGMTSLGYLYQQGKGVTKDAATARRWYTQAVAGGSVRAMFNLALLVIRGEGGERDFGEAVRLLKAAIEKGHIGAMRELAFLFDEGRGVARDARAAADFLLAAFKAGHPDARMDLLERPEAWSVATRKEVQRRLMAQGLYRGRANGFFDPATRRAIEAFAGKA